MITQKAKYAFKALVDLANCPRGASVQIIEIAVRQNIPRKFLEHILIALRKDGIVASRRGPGGGYYLVKDPADISLGHVLRLIDGPIAPLQCLSRSAYRKCDDCDEANCAVRRVFADIFAATVLTMEGTTLADALRNESPVTSLVTPVT
jgi:Rrf2 family protein